MGLLEDYDSVEPTIRKLYDSRLRLAILDALKEGPMRLSDLRRKVGANAPNTSSRAKELEDMGFIERNQGEFALTNWGRVIHNNISDSVQLLAAKENLAEYWQTHALGGIPADLIQGLKSYSKTELIKPKKDNIDYPDQHFVQTMKQRSKKRLWGMTPIFRPEYLDLIISAVQNGADVRIILQQDIVPSVLSSIPDELKAQLQNLENLKLYTIDEDLKLGFTIADDVCSCGFESRHGPSTFMDMNPESFDQETIDFQIKLFEHYLAKSKPIEYGI